MRRELPHVANREILELVQEEGFEVGQEKEGLSSFARPGGTANAVNILSKGDREWWISTSMWTRGGTSKNKGERHFTFQLFLLW